MTVVVDALHPDDWPAVRAIFASGIATGYATFESSVPDWPAWDSAHLAAPRLVARMADAVVGFCVLSAYSRRAVYSGVVWESVYVAPTAQGQGVGRALLEAMIAASEAVGAWTILAGIQAENAASIALHERCGFRRVGVHERLGQDSAGRWRDVVIFERRSQAAED
jgi:phosphinothricin acetyltransferase